MNELPNDKDLAPAESMLESVARSNLKDLASQYCEMGLDSVLDSGIVRDVPIVNTIVALTSSIMAIRDRMLIKKILSFLAAIESVPEDTRRKQLDSLASDPRERQRIGETLMLLLDRLDDFEKPELLARTFQAYLRLQIDDKNFQILAKIIDSMTMSSIRLFGDKYREGSHAVVNGHQGDVIQFLLAGLVSIQFREIDDTPVAIAGPGHVRKKPAGSFEVSGIGHLFYNIVLSPDRDNRT